MFFIVLAEMAFANRDRQLVRSYSGNHRDAVTSRWFGSGRCRACMRVGLGRGGEVNGKEEEAEEPGE